MTGRLLLPLLLLLLAGWVIVWRVVNQQLNPLTDLADTLNRQTHMSLEPVDESFVPIEIRPLTSAMNALLERLKTALDGQRKFIADAAHQLRTPLTAVKLHAEQAASASSGSRSRSARVTLESRVPNRNVCTRFRASVRSCRKCKKMRLYWLIEPEISSSATIGGGFVFGPMKRRSMKSPPPFMLARNVRRMSIR